MDREFIARQDDHRALRTWLRLFTCTQLIERRVRTGLREEFGTTLPRFDLMAQLERAPKGMTLGELSQRMMVSNGNITGLEPGGGVPPAHLGQHVVAAPKRPLGRFPVDVVAHDSSFPIGL